MEDVLFLVAILAGGVFATSITGMYCYTRLRVSADQTARETLKQNRYSGSVKQSETSMMDLGVALVNNLPAVMSAVKDPTIRAALPDLLASFKKE